PAVIGAAGQLAGRPLEEWNAAYVKVENYFHALRIRNKALLGQLVLRVLERAMKRAPGEPNHSTTQIAAEEMVRRGAARTTHQRRPAAFHARAARPASGRHARQMAGSIPPSRPLAGGIR